jgi:DNA-directed RNA polymerase subunit alpha
LINVVHEFSSIPGVIEDVTEIILNLKEINLRLIDVEEAVLNLSVEGEGVVTAANISPNEAVEILNPDKKIATLSKKGKLNMEMVVKMGKGYVPAERDSASNSEIGDILIDASFSPYTKVNYVVSNARVGQKTDYDRLTIEIFTDGSVLPEDALAYSAKILKEQMTPFINFEEEAEPDEVEEEEEIDKLNENLFQTCFRAELSVRSANCLKNAEITMIGSWCRRPRLRC